MAAKSIEERVRSLELRLETLIELLAKDGMKGASSARNWRRWIGAFTDDPDAQQAFRRAMKLRQANRQHVRQHTTKPSSSKS